MSELIEEFKNSLEAQQSELRVKLQAGREEVIEYEHSLREVEEALAKLEGLNG